jgi:hypothetical protein
MHEDDFLGCFQASIARSHNNINVMQWFIVFAKLIKGHSSPVNYVTNGHEYTKGSYKTDGIYPR